MKYLLLIISLVLTTCHPLYASILVFSPNGAFTVKSTLSAAATDDDTMGKTIVVTSALNATQSNISSATVHNWPADRALKVENGGSIANTTNFTFTVNGLFDAPRTQVFAGAGTVAGLQEVKVEWFGNDGAAIQKAITAANGRVPVQFGQGTFLSSQGFDLPPGTILQGPVVRYTPSGIHPIETPVPQTTIKFTSPLSYGFNAKTNNSIVFRNLNIDGNNMLDTDVMAGVDPDGFSTPGHYEQIGLSFENCLIQGAKVQGVLLGDSLLVLFDKSAVWGNYGDGLVVQNFTNLLTAQNSFFASNLGRGVVFRGASGSGFVNFLNSDFEGNYGYAVDVEGGFVNMKFDHIYTENIGTSSIPTHFIRWKTDTVIGQNDGNIFTNCTFGPGANNIRVANVLSGKLTFEHSNVFIPSNNAALLLEDAVEAVAGVSDVTINDSFNGVQMSRNVKITPRVAVDKTSPILFAAGATNAGIDVSSLAYTPGAGDFTLSTIVEMLDTPFTAVFGSPIIISSTNGLIVSLNGLSEIVSEISIIQSGVGSYSLTIPYINRNDPFHLVTVKTAGVLSIYINGNLFGAHADVANYNAAVGLIGGYFGGSPNYNLKMYNFTMYNSALTASQILQLWRNGGDSTAARITGNRKIDLNMSSRSAGYVYNNISSTWLAMGIGVSWVAPIVTH